MLRADEGNTEMDIATNGVTEKRNIVAILSPMEEIAEAVIVS